MVLQWILLRFYVNTICLVPLAENLYYFAFPVTKYHLLTYTSPIQSSDFTTMKMLHTILLIVALASQAVNAVKIGALFTTLQDKKCARPDGNGEGAQPVMLVY